MNGKSALCTVPIQWPCSVQTLKNELRYATPFARSRSLNIRIKRSIPVFAFIDGESYGPFRKNSRAKLPIPVALHLIWKDLAKSRETGPKIAANWFVKDWKRFFEQGVSNPTMQRVAISY
ncbi:MAG: hypothetical protein GF411_16555 [Candidatus Lokiarchaeota archaeon]|nr:hypothetical protein [Candidatus Lokiarchaeota archaeon]